MKMVVLTALILASTGAQAFFFTSTTPAGMLSQTTDSTSGSDRKMVINQAKDDAAAYVASNGQIQGPFLTRAIEMLREENPNLTANDTEIANAILASEN